MELKEAVERLQKEKENTIEAIECSLSGTSERNDWGGLVQAIDTVLKELNNSISKNLIKDELIKIKDYSECKYCNNTCKNYNKCMYFQQMLEVFD